jgi:hypothetical protein
MDIDNVISYMNKGYVTIKDRNADKRYGGKNIRKYKSKKMKKNKRKTKKINRITNTKKIKNKK